MSARKERFLLVGVGIIGLAIAVFFAFKALGNNMSYFYSPLEISQNKYPKDHLFRVGGMVVVDSLKRDEKDNLTVYFQITDNAKTINVQYHGILPDLFKEGQGVVADGKINEAGVFMATEVLAKHDENYMPPEAAAAMQKAIEQGAVKP